jgi:hypothetical protein
MPTVASSDGAAACDSGAAARQDRPGGGELPRGPGNPASAIETPDAEDMASPGQAEITGMDLIQRELGGKIIGEIED